MVDPARSLILAPKVRDLFFDANGQWIPSAYKVIKGGRAGLKTWGFARVALMLATARKLRIGCAREYQNSIAESVHETLRSQIDELKLGAYFKVNERAIKSRTTGAEFFFAGIKTDPRKFKSTEGIDILWIEEGEKISAASWRAIIPTVRRDWSEIWCGFNPDLPTDPTSELFIEKPHPLARIITTTWRDNPWLTDKLRAEKDYLAKVDPDAYAHVWEGAYRKNSAAQVLRGKISIEAFEPKPEDGWNGPYYGVDWGFSSDPTVMVRMWVKGTRLYIEYEAYGLGVDVVRLPALFSEIPGSSQHVSRADSARPETISHCRQNGFPRMQACSKWTNCAEDGVEHLRGYEQIVIHPRCEHTIIESRLWSYKQDKLSGDVLPELLDKHNHCWDAARYGLEPLIKRRGPARIRELRA